MRMRSRFLYKEMWEYLIYITAEQSFGAAPPFSMVRLAGIMSKRIPILDPTR